MIASSDGFDRRHSSAKNIRKMNHTGNALWMVWNQPRNPSCEKYNSQSIPEKVTLVATPVLDTHLENGTMFVSNDDKHFTHFTGAPKSLRNHSSN